MVGGQWSLEADEGGNEEAQVAEVLQIGRVCRRASRFPLTRDLYVHHRLMSDGFKGLNE